MFNLFSKKEKNDAEIAEQNYVEKKTMEIVDKATKKESQLKKVLHHLNTKGSITSWEAINLYRITRLSALIYILRDKGHNISTEMVYQNDSRFAVYHLGK